MKLLLLVGWMAFNMTTAQAQTMHETVEERKHYIGSTLFMAFTTIWNSSPEYYQLKFVNKSIINHFDAHLYTGFGISILTKSC